MREIKKKKRKHSPMQGTCSSSFNQPLVTGNDFGSQRHGCCYWVLFSRPYLKSFQYLCFEIQQGWVMALLCPVTCDDFKPTYMLTPPSFCLSLTWDRAKGPGNLWLLLILGIWVLQMSYPTCSPWSTSLKPGVEAKNRHLCELPRCLTEILKSLSNTLSRSD